MAQHKLFVSYRSTDSTKVDPLVHRLRSLGYQVWQDKDSIPAGQDWWEAICEGIVGCDVFIFMLSEESVKSFACQAELSYAHELNLPIIPCVIEGQWTYNAGGKYDIHFWSDIPQELHESRAQFLFYEGVSFVDKLKQGIDILLAKHMPRLPTARPPDPRHAADATNNVTVIYDEAYDFAYRGELEHAEKLFRKLIRQNDPIFGKISLEWVQVIDDYKRICDMAVRSSTRKIAQEQWNTYQAGFPKHFLEGLFDPKSLQAMFIEDAKRDRIAAQNAEAGRLARHEAEQKRIVQPKSSPQLLPAPFAWIEIPKKGYSIAKYPTTNAQFVKFIEAGGYNTQRWWTKAGWTQRESDKWTQPRYWNDSKWNGAEQPVVGVSWYESVAFCLWLSDVTGEKIMLPTEEQWQYAAQGDDGRAYPWGNQWNRDLCNNNVDKKGIGKTTPVRQYEGKGDSPFGVVDMAGNVWEWCLTDYENKTNDINNYATYRVLRGGSWYLNNAGYFRCGNRSWNNPHLRNNYWGYRVSRS
jgi:formylglycine-generating enzyme required for sulfatase activity